MTDSTSRRHLYIAPDGSREYLTDLEQLVDARALAEFHSLESAVGAGHVLGAAHSGTIDRVRASIAQLPPKRGDHWRAELSRLGVK